jgi:S1-C subfamily serine protease
VVPADLTPEVVQRFNLPTSTGVLVIQVSTGGPAEKAGIQEGDIITSFGGQKIGGVTDLLSALRQAQPGQKAEVTVQRGNDTKTFTATLSEIAASG